MKRVFRILGLSVALLAVAFAESGGRRTRPVEPVIYSPPARHYLPPDIASALPRPQLTPSPIDTFLLGSYTFDTAGMADPQGWTTFDLTTGGTEPYFHVADGTELDGGDFGNLLPLEGNQSMWCGTVPSSELCNYATLPGYGNNWIQRLVSQPFDCDGLRLYYRVFWDSEPDYDRTFVEWLDTDTGDWVAFPVNGGAGFYDGQGTLDEYLDIAVPSGTTKLRYRFESDGAWSDEDGFLDTDGAVIVDSIAVECYIGGFLDATYYEDFEDEAPGSQVTDDGRWGVEIRAPYGDFAALYPGSMVLQEDPCVTNHTWLWAFFDDPSSTNFACGGHPEQGAVPYVNDDGLYIFSEIWSPVLPFTGSGDDVRLFFSVYRDLPLDALIFYTPAVRDWVGGCPGYWDHIDYYYGGQRDWLEANFYLGYATRSNADSIQVALSVFDMCEFWCGIFGTGDCHTHGPLFDNVRVMRLDWSTPVFNVRHQELFQDNFAEDGTLTGTARADMANDILPGLNPSILPGDSLVCTATSVVGDLLSGTGPAVYAYVAVWPPGQMGKTGADLEAPEALSDAYPGAVRPAGKRFPLVGTQLHDGITWHCFRMDTAFTKTGGATPDHYCFDLNDAVLTPGDTICYFLCAKGSGGAETYFSRRLDGQGESFNTTAFDEAASSPMEFTILPAGGWARGGDVLFVDDCDDRGGPAQIYFDTAFELLAIKELVDRYDILSPTSFVDNSLASRVKNVSTQISGCYKKIIWSAGNLDGSLGDASGGGLKSDDFGLLYTFLDGNQDPGVYLSGDGVATSWDSRIGASAVALRSTFMNFNLIGFDHKAAGESVAPLLAGTGSCFTGDTLLAYGGCPTLNDFDVLEPTGLSTMELEYPFTRYAAVLGQATANSAASTGRMILSGFGYNAIRDDQPGFPPDRVDHLRDILLWLQNIVNEPTGLDLTLRVADFLDEAYPNPFNPTTTIRYGVARRGLVKLVIYNVAGQRVRTLVNEVKAPREGGFTLTWDGQNDAGQTVSSGVYFYKLTSPQFTRTKKIVLLK